MEAEQKAAIMKLRREHAKEIPQDAWLRVAAYDFLTGSGPKAASATPASPAHASNSKNAHGRAASAAPNASPTTTASTHAKAHSVAAPVSPSPKSSSVPSTPSAGVRAPHATATASALPAQPTAKQAAGGSGKGGLPSYAPAPKVPRDGGVLGGIGGGGGGAGVPEDTMALNFLKSDQKKLAAAQQQGQQPPDSWNGGIPHDDRLRQMAWNDLTGGVQPTAPAKIASSKTATRAAMPTPPWRQQTLRPATGGGEAGQPTAEGGREGAKDVSWQQWQEAGGARPRVQGGAEAVDKRKLNYRGLPKDGRLRAMAWQFMNGGDSQGSQDDGSAGEPARMEGEVKEAGRELGNAKVREERQLAKELHDQALLKAAASLADKQEQDLATRIQEAEERLRLISQRGGGERRGEEPRRERDDRERAARRGGWREPRRGDEGRGRSGEGRGGWPSLSHALTGSSELLKRTLSHAEIMTEAEERLRGMERRKGGDREERARRRGEAEERARERERERRERLEESGRLGQLTRKVRSMQRRLEQIRGIRADDEALWRHGF